MTPIVCILNEDDARSFSGGGMAYKCSSHRHHHYGRKAAEALVKTGDLLWLGKHKRVATYRDAREWVKVYTRNEFGEVIWCGMQLVRGGG